MMTSKSLTIFGDSIAVGQGISLHNNWVYRISEEFPDLFVVNASQNGRTSRLALEAMPYEIQNHAPNILIVQFGLNDSNFWISDHGLPRVSEESFLYNLIEIYDRAINFKVDHVFFLNNHQTKKKGEENRVYNENVAIYTNLINSIPNFRSEAKIVNTWEMCSNSDANVAEGNLDYILQDGVHLSLLGHGLYFQIIAETIKRII